MLRFLFPRLTPPAPRGSRLFAATVAEARKPFWYSDLGVPDTLDGRFSVLATVTALATIRLERGDDDARRASVALAERFIESMDHEHRQLGYGDPTIGKIVRRLTGSLAGRVERFRSAIESGGWPVAAASSLLGIDGEQPAERAADYLLQLWEKLERQPDSSVIDGDWS